MKDSQTKLMRKAYRKGRPTVGVLAGWQFYRTATPLNYLNPLFGGIRAAAHDHSCNLVLACGMGASADPHDPLRPAWPEPSPDADFVPVGPWNTDALIIANPLLSQSRSQYLEGLMAAGHTVVFVGGGEPGPTIVVDNQGGVLQAIQHLIEHGHRRIAFIAGTAEDAEGDAGERLRAYQRTVQSYHLAEAPGLIAYGRHTFSGGMDAMRQIIGTGIPFTAVLASNDESAIGAMQAIQEAGLRIPQDVAVIGFDDRLEAIAQTPALTSVRIPLFKMGYRALELALQCLTGQAAPCPFIQIPTQLVVRQSCGCWYRDIPLPSDSSSAPEEPDDRIERQAQLESAMSEAVLAESRLLSADEIRAACRTLVGTFIAGLQLGPAEGFSQAFEGILAQTIAMDDDPHIWQAALSLLRNAAPTLIAPWPAAGPRRVQAMLDQARVAISDSARKQHRRYIANQHVLSDHLGLLTAQLLQALDEDQILETLEQHLQIMGVTRAAMAFYEGEADDPVAWSVLRQALPATGASPSGTAPAHRFPSRTFPFPGLVPDSQPFSLALVPLAGQRSRTGFMVFDSARLEIYGVIVQQVAAALHSALLYLQATEGRRLAEEANQLKSHFLSIVSHELRTPLNLIVGLSDMVLREKDICGQALPETFRADLARIHASAQHLGWLIRDVLDLASSEAGQLRLTNTFLDLSETLQIVAETGRQLAQEKGLAWDAALPESGPWVWGDQTRLRQVALNLVNNAVKFTTRGGVSVRVEEAQGAVTVSVADTGLGIPPEEQSLIFDEFRRSERATSRGYGGLGLGLAICKRLVDLHGGKIEVRSSGEEGAGSTFSFTLPTVRPVNVEADEAALDQVTGQAVLLLTNRAGNADRLREYLHLRSIDVRVLRLDETPDWPSQLRLNPPEMVILDIGLAPTMGWELLKALKASPATQHIPVLFCALTEHAGTVLELEYLTKPVDSAGLAQALAQQGLAAEDGPAAAQKTILIVDDDPATLEMHARMVRTQSAACEVLTARNGREALEQLERQHPDLVLLDLMMPELDGFGVLEAMREKEVTRAIPVVVLTGQTLTEKDMARLNQGVATVLSKGMFNVEETLAHVEAALARKRKLSGKTQRLVRLAMAYLHEHYAEPLSRDDLARHVGFSDDYLTYCFRKELGMTPITYLNRYRISQAKVLLKESDRSITEIALAVGFSDSGYFSRVFRREVDLTPEAYRRV